MDIFFQVRKQNYDRRLDQMTNRGFVSLIQEPYKSIGHPVYVDNKQLITDALGLPKVVSLGGALVYVTVSKILA